MLWRSTIYLKPIFYILSFELLEKWTLIFVSEMKQTKT